MHRCPVCFKTMAGCSSPLCPDQPCWHLKRHHRNVHEGVRDFRCSVCGAHFGQKGNAAKHIKVNHDGVGTVVGAEYNGPFQPPPAGTSLTAKQSGGGGGAKRKMDDSDLSGGGGGGGGGGSNSKVPKNQDV